MDGREFKDGVFGHFARVGAALGNARRVEIVDVLAQGERSVEDLAREVSSTLGNTSRNLQILAAAGLVSRRVEGTSRFYRLSHPSVLAAYQALVAVAEARIAEVSALASAFFADSDGAHPMSLSELQQAMAADEQLTLIDVRPEREYDSGHVPGAINLPLAELAERMADLPKDTPIVAYCRGPYCVMAASAVHQLREAGFPAARLEIGYPTGSLRPARCRARPTREKDTDVTTLFILNDPPYGTERVYNGLRLAANLQRLDEGHDVVVFLMGDAASAAKAGQSVPNGYYNVNKMLGNVLGRNGRILVCGTCMDARGVSQDELIDGAQRSTLDGLTQETLAADKVLVF